MLAISPMHSRRPGSSLHERSLLRSYYSNLIPSFIVFVFHTLAWSALDVLSITFILPLPTTYRRAFADAAFGFIDSWTKSHYVPIYHWTTTVVVYLIRSRILSRPDGNWCLATYLRVTMMEK
jgi:hypothetical protein